VEEACCSACGCGLELSNSWCAGGWQRTEVEVTDAHEALWKDV